MTRCTTEILRMWPANSNGTFRELTQPETIFINDTQQIELPIGTYCQIPNWSRHRSKKLWGNDVNMSDPDRGEFKQEEIWDNHIIHIRILTVIDFTIYIHPEIV